MSWNSETEAKVTVEVMGNITEYKAEGITAEKIVSIAKARGLSKFNVTVNGEEVLSPDDFKALEGGEKVKLIPYDEWGNR